jgi:hypothetical protein
MKAIEILSESRKINEAPASMLGQIARRAGAGILGAIGLNTLAGQINDKADVGMFANRYYKEFMNYLKTRNRSPEQATFGDLKSFMSKNKIPTHNVPNNPAGVASKEMVNSILNQTADEFLSNKTVKGNNNTQQTKQQSGGASSSTGSTNRQSSTGNANGGQAQTTNPSVPRTPADVRAQKQAQAAQSARDQMTPVTSQSTTGKITMKSIKSSIANLSKNERSQLRKMIAARAGV